MASIEETSMTHMTNSVINYVCRIDAAIISLE